MGYKAHIFFQPCYITMVLHVLFATWNVQFQLIIHWTGLPDRFTTSCDRQTLFLKLNKWSLAWTENVFNDETLPTWYDTWKLTIFLQITTLGAYWKINHWKPHAKIDWKENEKNQDFKKELKEKERCLTYWNCSSEMTRNLNCYLGG